MKTDKKLENHQIKENKIKKEVLVILQMKKKIQGQKIKIVTKINYVLHETQKLGHTKYKGADK